MQTSNSADLEAYLAISRAIAGELDFVTVLQRISEVVREKLLPHDHMDVAVLVPDAPEYHVAFEAILQTDWSNAAPRIANAKSPIRKLLDGTAPYLLTGDAWTDERFHFEGAAAGPIYDANLRSRVHVPLTVHADIQGALSFSLHSKEAYRLEDVAIAQKIADLIAPYAFALNQGERARLSQQAAGTAHTRTEDLRKGALQLNDAMEAERRRIGMELHDQTLAELSTIYRFATKNALESRHCGDKFAKISDDISLCMAELRGIIENARPGVLEMLGLRHAIEAHLDRTLKAHDVPVSYGIDDWSNGALDLCNEAIRTAVFRIIQEAVTNAVTHADCKELRVILLHQGEDAEVIIENDGQAPAEGWERSLGGVNNIRIRADLISAEVRFEAPEGGGFRIALKVPLAAEETRAAWSNS